MTRWSMALRPSGGLGIAAISYVTVDYLRHLSPTWHERLQPILWSLLAVIAISRVPFYKHWSAEFRAVIPFLASLLFLLVCLLLEAISVRSVTAVLGLDWHRDTPPLPDPGQWFLLWLNENLPEPMVEILRARIVGLHHYLMLFIMLGFSVLFGSVQAPGFGLGARYIFTMAIGRILRTITFVSTILPSARPWCAAGRFQVPTYPHPWPQKYYIPYASDSNAIRQILQSDWAYAETEVYPSDYRPDWGVMSFLVEFLRPIHRERSTWYNLLTKAGGGCNDLIYSGHMFVAVLTAMAWTEAYGGFTSAFIWLLVLHSAQREVRERHHYAVDCVVAIYVGILLWKTIGFMWPVNNATRITRLNKLEKIERRLVQAAKDSDMEKVRELLNEVEAVGNDDDQNKKGLSRSMMVFSWVTAFSIITIVFLAFIWTSDG
ncbi:Protein PHLOEM UNLOADING MODULATOR [Linum perenne]